MSAVSRRFLEHAHELLSLGKKWRARSPVWSGGDRAYLDVEMHRLFRRIAREYPGDSKEDAVELRRAEKILEKLSVLLWG